MTLLADYLRSTDNEIYRIYPNADGELVIDTDLWEDGWTDESYIIPTESGLTYRTLADSAGTTWYLYASNQELVLTTTAPSATVGTWNDYIYGNAITETEATVGDEIYLALADSDSTDWYVYPNSDGELIITTTEPS
ncbi:MAG: hypothetical protein KKC77_19170 [Proteobacteria bacterium]|nr:hypothetical protein [Pseudomonadota bacterium]